MRNETTSIPVTDKVSLAAVIHHPLVANNKVLIVSHGFRGSKESGGRGSLFGDAVARIGFTVVRFDFTPCQPLSSQVTELQNIIQWSSQHLGREIYLLGRSMGGSASLLAASQISSVAGLCLWATPADLEATFRLSLGSGYEQLRKGEVLLHKDEWGEVILLPDFIQDFKRYDLYVTITNLAKRNIPLLILHGSHDTVVPIEQAERLFSLAGHPKKFVILEDAHQFTYHYETATDAVVRWLEGSH